MMTEAELNYWQNWKPRPSDVQFMATMISTMKDGGVWGVPMNKTTYIVDKKRQSFVLVSGQWCRVCGMFCGLPSADSSTKEIIELLYGESPETLRYARSQIFADHCSKCGGAPVTRVSQVDSLFYMNQKALEPLGWHVEIGTDALATGAGKTQAAKPVFPSAVIVKEGDEYKGEPPIAPSRVST